MNSLLYDGFAVLEKIVQGKEHHKNRENKIAGVLISAFQRLYEKIADVFQIAKKYFRLEERLQVKIIQKLFE